MFLFLYLLGVTLVLLLLDSCDVVGGVGVLVLASKGNFVDTEYRDRVDRRRVSSSVSGI